MLNTAVNWYGAVVGRGVKPYLLGRPPRRANSLARITHLSIFKSNTFVLSILFTMSEEDLDAVKWSVQLETYFKETAEKSECLSVLHKHAEGIFSNRKVFLELPCIVLSAVVGFCSVGSGYMFDNNQMLSSITLGVGSLFVSTLQTVNSYFGWSRRAEGHRISAIQYAKQHRFLLIELALPREERMTAGTMLKMIRADYDRLAEISPMLPPESTAYFNSKYPDIRVSKPPEVNGLEPVQIYRDERLSIRIPPTPIKSPVDSNAVASSDRRDT